MDTQTAENPPHSPRRSSLCSPDEQPACAEPARARRGTDETFNSASTFASEKCGKTLELQTSTDSSTLVCSKTTTGDEKGGTTHERAPPGRWQRFHLRWLTPYRVLISIVMSVNLGTSFYMLFRHSTVEVPLTATATNIMIAALMRQEELINLSFKLVAKLPTTLPLTVRARIGDLHHYGGIHVSCALSALVWYIMFTGVNTVRILDFLSQGRMTAILYADIVTAYAALLAILLVCMTAIPRLRVRCHNTFEATHRFGGWAALIVLWIHAGITSLTPDSSVSLYAHPSLWMLTLTTICMLLPWLRIRRVSVEAHHITPREVQLTFLFNNMPHTSTIRTSTTPLMEWHAFATIPLDQTTARIIISKAGDWTNSIITSPPSHLWIRRPATLSFLTVAPLFTSLLLVATGAGIGPMLSLLASPAVKRIRSQGRKIKVMWCVANPVAPHWSFVLTAIREVDAEAVIFDSRAGRPDLAFEARYLGVKEGVEAVMVVSNPKVTREVVHECKLAGLAAYGPVFDS